MNQIKETKWYEIPNIITLSYAETERAKVKYIFPNVNRWRTDIKYNNIKLIFFETCDRGIDCWKEFNNFLKIVFPNLEVLFLHQSWTYDNTHALDYSDQDINKITNQIKQNELSDFMNDKWLKVIWIKQESDQFPNYNDTQSEYIRVMYKNRSECPGNCYKIPYDYYDDCYCYLILIISNLVQYLNLMIY